MAISTIFSCQTSEFTGISSEIQVALKIIYGNSHFRPSFPVRSVNRSIYKRGRNTFDRFRARGWQWYRMLDHRSVTWAGGRSHFALINTLANLLVRSTTISHNGSPFLNEPGRSFPPPIGGVWPWRWWNLKPPGWRRLTSCRALMHTRGSRRWHLICGRIGARETFESLTWCNLSYIWAKLWYSYGSRTCNGIIVGPFQRVRLWLLLWMEFYLLERKLFFWMTLLYD